MIRFLIQRLLFAVVVFFAAVFFVWLLTTRYGIVSLDATVTNTDPYNIYSGFNIGHADFFSWLSQMLHGNFGYSTLQNEPISTLVHSHIAVSFLIIIPVLIIQEVVALTLGVFSSVRSGSVLDKLIMNVEYFFSAMPSFWFALIGIIIFAVHLHWFSFDGMNDVRLTGSGWDTPAYWQFFHQHTLVAIIDVIRHLELPILVLVLGSISTDSQLLRSSMLEVLSQEYIRAARARGIKEWVIVWRHALRNALLPVMTSIGAQLPRLVFTVAIIEDVFNLPGLGGLFIHSIITFPRIASNGDQGDPSILHPVDPSLVTVYLFLFAIVVLVTNIATDAAYALADPRVRNETTV